MDKIEHKGNRRPEDAESKSRAGDNVLFEHAWYVINYNDTKYS